MPTHVYRKGAGSPAVLAGAIAIWISAAVIFLFLSVPELAPGFVLRLFWESGPPAPTEASRLVGLALTVAAVAIGVFLLRVAPFLGGRRISIGEEGIEYVDHDTWVTAPWGAVQAITSSGETDARQTYTVTTYNGSFTFSSSQIDRADELAAAIEAKIGQRR